MYHFCTYFDHNYLSRGLALYHSLKLHVADFRLWVLCLDQQAYDILGGLDLPGIELIKLDEFEKNDEPLLAAKQNRSIVEYYFTCTPSLPLYIFNHNPEINLITYLDSDLYFFSSPGSIFQEIGEHSIAIIDHRFPPSLRHFEDKGKFNVGWLSFRRDEFGLACLLDWRERCIEWCYDRVEDGRYADQKYLDDWPNKFSNLVIIEHLGANLAPWSLQNYHFSYRDKQVYVDEQPLIFFHFQGFFQVRPWLFHTGFISYSARPPRIARRKIYAPYTRLLVKCQLELSRLHPDLYAITERYRGQLTEISEYEKNKRRVMNFLVGEYLFYLSKDRVIY